MSCAPKFGRCLSNSVEPGLNLADFGPTSANIGHKSVDSNQVWPNSPEIWAM